MTYALTSYTYGINCHKYILLELTQYQILGTKKNVIKNCCCLKTFNGIHFQIVEFYVSGWPHDVL